jgi:hypothetical protein
LKRCNCIDTGCADFVTEKDERLTPSEEVALAQLAGTKGGAHLLDNIKKIFRSMISTGSIKLLQMRLY